MGDLGEKHVGMASFLPHPARSSLPSLLLPPQESRDVEIDLVELNGRWNALGRDHWVGTADGVVRGEHFAVFRHLSIRIHTRSQKGDENFALSSVLRHVPHEDLGIFRVGKLDEILHGVVRFADAEVRPRADVDEEPLGALDARFQQRAVGRGFRRQPRALIAYPFAEAHQSDPRVLHDCPDVGEVDIDEPWEENDIADALHALAQDVVRR